jgi:MOSC domain-containing protein YiiM
MGQVIAIFKKGKKGAPMIPLETAEVIAGRGIRGSRGGRPNGKRQVLIMPAELLDTFGLSPGAVRENITTRGVDVMALRPGDGLHIGEVVLEAMGDCKPCEFIEGIRPGLQAEMLGHRGMLFRVVEGGEIA